MNRSRQAGFTLVELVVVIIVLGILAAFAVPRFMGIDTQARIASVNSLAGTLRSTAAMAHSVYMARGNPPNPVTIDGQNVFYQRLSECRRHRPSAVTRHSDDE
jgi:MSHA pilin protein MshA